MICRISPESMARAAALLRAGHLVAFPTETVYGLGADALNPSAVRRIFEVKGRPATSPLIVHVDSIERAHELVRDWPENATRLAEKFWPGPLTLVLSKRPMVPDEVTAGLGTVGIRIPAHPVALELLRAAGTPVAAPSANRFTQLSPTTAQHVFGGLGDSVEIILDAGPCAVGIESTVLSLATAVPTLLRPGTISLAQLTDIIGRIEPAPPPVGAHTSPGQHLRHYQPRTRLIMPGPKPLPQGRGAYLRLPPDAGLAAACLYDKLHALDALNLDWIAVEPVPETREWDGVRDRLLRASAH